VYAWQANYQAFVNGVMVGDSGGMPPRASPQMNTARDFAIDPKLISNGDVTIAIRLWHYGAGGPLAPFTVGLGLMPDLRKTRGFELATMLPSLVPVFTGLGVALLAIGLFRDQRERREYLWLSVYGIVFVLDTALILFTQHRSASARLVYGSGVLVNGILLVTFIEFFLTFMGIRRRPWMRIYQACLVVVPTVLELVYLLQPISYLVGVALLVPATLGLVGILAVEFRRKNPAAGVLILPTLLALGIFTIQSVASILMQYHFNLLWLFRLLVWNVGYFQISAYSTSLMFFWLSIGLIILVRAHRATEDQARLTGEMEAARGVQQLLLASGAAAAEGFKSESIYLPASEVGGDFFHLSRGEDGSLLVVVGDVSGKGLRAAMTVSAIIGCLRGGGTRAPEAVLKKLNNMLTGQITGFVTCCAGLLAADGTATFSNAGHINPYLEGRELPLEGNLPLGLMAEVDYRSEQVLLREGDRLTFLSDGVVEATNQAMELFGFERARAMSLDSPRRIADAARDFGQEDDISVVAVTFQPVGVAVE
jgi:sigma-B regulation protein RsbU (phosphoserine phosphatase)